MSLLKIIKTKVTTEVLGGAVLSSPIQMREKRFGAPDPTGELIQRSSIDFPAGEEGLARCHFKQT